jgi:hypothetical protein
MHDQPFFTQTQRLLDCVRDHNFTELAQLCDDDFGIVDLNDEGGSVVIRTRAEWEDWFRTLFAKLDHMQAQTWSEITGYQAVQTTEMGYSVVDFDQLLVFGGKRLRFTCISTIIWKKAGDEWKEARYHSSLLNVRDESAA